MEIRTGNKLSIKNSTIEGDIVGGDKITEINLFVDKISSAEELLDLIEHPSIRPDDLKTLFQKILKTPRLMEKFDKTRKENFTKNVNDEIRKILQEYQQYGEKKVNKDSIWILLNKAKKEEDIDSYFSLANLLFGIEKNTPSTPKEYLQLADDIIVKGKDLPEYSRPLAMAYSFKGKYISFNYQEKRINLQTTLMMYNQLPIKQPLIKLKEKYAEILILGESSHGLLLKAINVAIENRDVEMAAIALINYCFFLESDYFYLKIIRPELKNPLFKKILETYELIRDISKDDPRISKEMLAYYHNNLSVFYLRDENMKLTEDHAGKALDLFLELGQSARAKIARDTLEEARNNFKISKTIPLEEEMDGELCKEMLEDTSRRMLDILGYNLDNNPKLKSAYELAIKDADPTYVYKYCEHIEVYNNTSPVGRSIGLESMGMKTIECLKNNEAVSGVDLELVFNGFKEDMNCSNCPYHSPRSNNWKWTLAWANREKPQDN